MIFIFYDVAEQRKVKKKTGKKRVDYILQMLLRTFTYLILFKKLKIKNCCHA